MNAGISHDRGVRMAGGKRKTRRKRLWSFSVGEHGYTVRVFEVYAGSNLYRSVWIPATREEKSRGEKGREDRESLGHKDRECAILDAHQLIAHLRSMGNDLPQGEITLGALRARYVVSQAHAAKKERTRQEDERKLERVVEFLGPTLRAAALDQEKILRYVAARRDGDARLLHVRKRRPGATGPAVRDRAVEADLVALHTMLRWGCTVKNDRGLPLLAADPLKGVAFPKELNPRRPIVNEDDYEALVAVADRVHPILRPGLIVSNGTGRRLSAWRQLRWKNVHFDREQYGAIHWPGETDKNRIALFRPISPAVRDALLALRPPKPDPDAFVFPSPQDPTRPVSKRQFYEWMLRAYEEAGLEPEEGSMWHAVRRKWVTERKGYPLADIAAAGGWKDERSLKAYMQEDPETVRKVVLEPTHRLRRGDG
jgi:integrase